MSLLNNKLKQGLTYPIELYNCSGNRVYYEDSEGYWWKKEYNSNYKEVYYETSNNYWYRLTRDSNNNIIKFKDSYGCWYKRECDSNGVEIYYENEDGILKDNRPKKVINLKVVRLEDKLR